VIVRFTGDNMAMITNPELFVGGVTLNVNVDPPFDVLNPLVKPELLTLKSEATAVIEAELDETVITQVIGTVAR